MYFVIIPQCSGGFKWCPSFG